MILLMVVVLVVVLGACHEQTVGYLITENASYVPDSMLIPRTLDPQKDAIRIEYNAPWVTTNCRGMRERSRYISWWKKLSRRMQELRLPLLFKKS